jgi:long-chain acyl-CoA synthetase
MYYKGEEIEQPENDTIVHVFARWATDFPETTALIEKRGESWHKISWREYGEKVLNIACGLQALGIEKGDRVAIFSENRVEWTYADMGILAAGAVSVPIYATSAAEQVLYILNHSSSKVIFVNSKEQLEKVNSILPQMPDLEKVISFIYYSGEDIFDLSFEEFLDLGRKYQRTNALTYNDLCSSLSLEDINAIMYTSGTTGPPKGCLLSHGNIIYICQSVSYLLPLDKDDLVLSFLPLAHSMERHGGQFLSIYFRLPTAYSASLDSVRTDLIEVQPTWSRAVPRFFEKAYNRVQAAVQDYSPVKKKIFNWALKVGKESNIYRQDGKKLPLLYGFRYKIADRLVYRKIKKLMGGRMRFFISGGAPLAREIIEFFSSLGLLIAEGYGLTECTVVCSINRLDHYRFGTVGLPIPGAEIKIAADGEILIRSPGVLKGYYKDEAATREAIDAEGWFYSGDIGYFNEEGFLVISDRKKDMIITAGGKNITPQNLENALKTHPLSNS